jgi:putative ABC transport system permease protein
MHRIGNALAWVGVVRRRLRSHLGLVLAIWAGFTLAIAMVVSIPVYAEAAGYRILLAGLAKTDVQDPLPPFSLVYTYGGGSDPGFTWFHFEAVDKVASNLPAAGLSLPVKRAVSYAATEGMRLRFPDDDKNDVMSARFAFATDFQNHVQLVDGHWPAPWNGSGPVDVLVSEVAALKNTILVDDLYRLHSPPGYRIDLDLPIRVAGIWQAPEKLDEYWFYPPSAFSEQLLVPRESFAKALGGRRLPWLAYAAWYTAPDFNAVRSANVSRLIGEIGQATGAIDRLLPGVELKRSPQEALVRHRDQVRLLTVTLALFSAPLFALLAFFIMQVAGMIVQRQQQEIAILRSRGSTRLEVVGLLLGEGVLLGAAALLAGVPLGLLMARLIASTQSFLHFAPLPGPPIQLLPASWRHGALVLALAIPALLVPALLSSGRTIISFKQERGRGRHVPLWRRMFLDLLLLIPALYGYQQLRLHGSIGVPGIAAAQDDPFRNPLLMLAPALLVFALALVALRLLPRLLALLAGILARTRGVALLMALRFLVRTAQAYSTPVLLIALTLSLAAFTASMARTLDEHSADRARYSAGADVRLVYQAKVAADATAGSGGSGGSGGSTPESADYLLVPVDEYLKLPGVQAVTRVAVSTVFIGPANGGSEQGRFVGVDRQTLAAVLAKSWRADYAGESLGALMNRLAADPAAVLVPKGYAAKHGLKLGDRINVELNDLGETHKGTFVVAGLIDYFPTQYMENGPYLIGNLDYSQEVQGSAYPYEIWLDVAPGTDIGPIQAEGYGYNLSVLPGTPRALLEADLLRPERQGLFGLLSVGFMAAALVTILGFLAHTLLSFQRRLVELGMLRAIGLASRQLATLLIAEQALVIGAGIAVGTGLGVLVSRLFVPFLQVRAEAFPDTPPFRVQIAWNQIALIYGVAGILLLATVVLTILLLRRMRIFEVVKLGEAV